MGIGAAPVLLRMELLCQAAQIATRKGSAGTDIPVAHAASHALSNEVPPQPKQAENAERKPILRALRELRV